MYSKAKAKNQHEKYFLIIKKQCLLINGCQAVNYESGTIKYKIYEKQVPILFKIYADTECFLKTTNSYEGEYTIKYQEHFF